MDWHTMVGWVIAAWFILLLWMVEKRDRATDGRDDEAMFSDEENLP